MKKILLSAGIAFLLLLSNSYALEGKYMYVSLSYGQGWWPWVCTTEKGMKGVWGKDYKCDQGNVRGCPFEQGKMMGQLLCVSPGFIGQCGDPPKTCVRRLDDQYQVLLPPSYGILTRINIPEDYKLAMADGTVVGDEICVGDKLQLTKGVNKGEFYGDGGNDDSPPVYWVDDVEALVKKIMDYHEKTSSTWNTICAKSVPADGFVDPLSGVPVYTTSVPLLEAPAAYVTGNVVCSLKGEGGSGFSPSGSYTATSVGEVNLAAAYSVLCMYYYYGGVTASGVASMGYWSDFQEQECPFMTLRVPTVLQDGPSASLNSYNDHPYASSAADYFKVGAIGVNKKVKVSAPSNGAASVSLPSGEDIKFSQENDIRVAVKNTGSTDLSIKKVYTSSGGTLLSCDSEIVKPGAESECLIRVVPSKADFRISVDYEYKSCGRTKTGTATRALFSSQKNNPVLSMQLYGMEVYGSCRNTYYGCSYPDKDGRLYAGYACQNKETFYAPEKERFALKYELPDMSSKTILKASLNMRVAKVNKMQIVSVYSIENNWEPVSCTAEGDICTQPYCAVCKPAYDLSGTIQDKQSIETDGMVSFDVTGIVSTAYGSKQKVVSFQVRGIEDTWDSEGATSCDKSDEWVRQDVEFYGEGPSQPYLEITVK
jgi:hypothetical protein